MVDVVWLVYYRGAEKMPKVTVFLKPREQARHIFARGLKASSVPPYVLRQLCSTALAYQVGCA